MGHKIPLLVVDTVVERLKNKTVIDKVTGCWLFQGQVNEHGYGRLKYKRKTTRINRISAYLFLGLDLDNFKLLALHKPICLNRNCWNPEHLYVGTQEDNVWDSVRMETNNFASRKKRWWSK